ncbi:MAG: DUF1150 family protein [Acetobacteraceae bacterium]|nr:DUF1150 family protein [Acetobacteraceae bacterium]
MTEILKSVTDTFLFDIRHLSEREFAELGVAQVAYVKPVIVDGKSVFAIHAANGTPMALVEGRDIALAAVTQHEMVPVLVH